MNCPVREDTEKIAATGKDLVRQMRKLREDLIRCKKCQIYRTCWLIKNYNGLVNTAILELMEEWRSQA